MNDAIETATTFEPAETYSDPSTVEDEFAEGDASEDLSTWMPPKGFDNYDNRNGTAVWWRWVAPSKVTCSEYATTCWQIEAVSETGCPNGVYAALNFLDAGGTVVGYTNDLLPGLAPDQVGKLTFDMAEDLGDVETGEIAEISCN